MNRKRMLVGLIGLITIIWISAELLSPPIEMSSLVLILLATLGQILLWRTTKFWNTDYKNTIDRCINQFIVRGWSRRAATDKIDMLVGAGVSIEDLPAVVDKILISERSR